MLRSLKDINGYKLNAVDDNIGKIIDFYFDDLVWKIRYIVSDTGRWLPGRKLLISSQEIETSGWADHLQAATLARDKIQNSPDMKVDLPVSRQEEIKLVQYYGWEPYWESKEFSSSLSNTPPESPPVVEPASDGTDDDSQTHLRSVNDITGYHIEANDGEIGHVEDIIVEADDWVIRYLVVNTGKWLPGRKVLISPTWTQKINWSEKNLISNLSREDIEHSPEFDPTEPVNREYETQLYDYYGRPAYWSF